MIELTKYELLEVAGTYHALAVSTLMGYFSILSAYLIVAYLAGGRLGRLQVMVVSGLFLTAALGMTWGTGAYFYIAQDYLLQSGRRLPITEIQPHELFTPVLLLGILCALYFMWDVRHPKTE
jgi:hypothetical protein